MFQHVTQSVTFGDLKVSPYIARAYCAVFFRFPRGTYAGLATIFKNHIDFDNGDN